jgi:hypothetical protein
MSANSLFAVLHQLELVAPGECPLAHISVLPQGPDGPGQFVAERLRLVATLHHIQHCTGSWLQLLEKLVKNMQIFNNYIFY